MPWLHRTNKTYIQRASPSTMANRYPPLVFVDGEGKAANNAEWIWNPDLSAVVGQPTRYWEITGDVVSLMDQAARDAVDAQLLSDRRDRVADQLDAVESIDRAFALVVLDEINTLRAEHALPDRTIAQLKTALRNKLGT